MAQRWQPRDADGILILVSPRVGVHIYFAYKPDYYRPVRSLPQPLRCDHPGLQFQAKQSGYLILPWEHLPGSHRSEFNTHIYSLPDRQTIAVL